LRFLTRPAFLDALIDTIIDPPSGLHVFRFSMMLSVYITYFCIYTLLVYPCVFPNGELEPEHASVLNSLRPENRPIFETRIRGKKGAGWLEEMLARREFMKTTGMLFCMGAA
ncbi:hypothetical protein B0H10DRAFT_1791685, partial [Mycena sp. CBHHK59/15]